MDDKHLQQAYDRIADKHDEHTRAARLEPPADAARPRFAGPNWTRRNFLAASAGATAATAVGQALLPRASHAAALEDFSQRFDGVTQSEVMKTIGLGVSVQERFFRKFKEVSGLEVTGTVAGLSEMIQKFIAGGYRDYSMIETNSYRQPALREAGVIQPIPREKITNWEFADSLFTDPNHIGAEKESGWPVRIVWWDDNEDSFFGIPQFYNLDALGILPHKFAPTQPDYATPDGLGLLYEGKWRDVDAKGKVSIQNDNIFGVGRAASYLVKNRKMDPPKVSLSDLRPDEVAEVVDYLIGAKKDGIFRLIWNNYGEAVNLLASEEVWGMDCWNPVVEDVKKRGIPCWYVDVWEGTAAWVHTMCLSKESREPEVAMAYMDWTLEGWWGASVAPQGYYSPCPQPVQKYLSEEEWLHWYEGEGRDTGPKLRRQSNAAFWQIWPEHISSYIEEWSRFTAA